MNKMLSYLVGFLPCNRVTRSEFPTVGDLKEGLKSLFQVIGFIVSVRSRIKQDKILFIIKNVEVLGEKNAYFNKSEKNDCN